MTTASCAVFLLVVVVCSVSVECHKGHGGEYGHGHYGGNYGSGGGHYSIGFGEADLKDMCADDAACKSCFEKSQDLTGEKKTLNLADSRQCAMTYLISTGWAQSCIEYANDMVEKYSGKEMPAPVYNMFSFCMRTSSFFSNAGRCNPEDPWKTFYKCASGSDKEDKKPSGEKKGEEKRRRSAFPEIPREGGPYGK